MEKDVVLDELIFIEEKIYQDYKNIAHISSEYFTKKEYRNLMQFLMQHQ